MAIYAITRGLPPLGVKPASILPHPAPYLADRFEVFEAPEQTVLLTLLEEQSPAPAATLLGLTSQSTETAETWYRTGNPFALIERWSMPVKTLSAVGKCTQATLPLLDRLRQVLAVPASQVRAAEREGGLASAELYQDRWLLAPWQSIATWLVENVGPWGNVDLLPPCGSANGPIGERLYLVGADGLDDWAKVGMADTVSPRVRLQRQQLCNSRTLRHLAVWHTGLSGSALKAAERSLKTVLMGAGAIRPSPIQHPVTRRRIKAGEEWFRLRKTEALDRLGRHTAEQGRRREA